MQNDSIESLLLRHYGNTAPTPTGLEQRLLASIRQEAEESRQQALHTAQLHQRRVSRRQAVRFVAIGATGLSILTAGLEMLEAGLAASQDLSQTASP